MALFTSKREKRLWIWLGLVMIAIYTTLGLAGVWEEKLRDRHMLDDVFFAAFLMVILAIALSGLYRGVSKYEIWAYIGIVAIYGTIFLRMSLSVEHRSHLFEYGMVAILVLQAILERHKHSGKPPYPALVAVGITVLLGILDEGIQAIIPNRVFDVNDIIFNTLAGTMAIVASMSLRWIRMKFSSHSRRKNE